MDVLLSIPLFSYLISPAHSWSTSMNLVFFYMTWATLVLSHPPIEVHLVGITAIRALFWLLPALIGLIFDVGVPSLAESIKHGGRASIPPRDLRKLSRIVGLVVFNALLMIAAEGIVSFAYIKVFGETVFRMHTTLPFPWQIFKHIVIMMVGREVLTYYLHRFVLHGGSSRLAQLHKQYAHALRGAPFALQLFADHPLPLLVHRFLPMYLPGALLRPHMISYFMFLAICTVEETFGMSGYTVTPGYILTGISARTSIHYASGGDANYGAYGIFDWAHGTSRGRDILKDIRAEAEQHHLKERSAAKVNKGAGFLQNGLNSGLDALKDKAEKSEKSDRRRSSRKAA